jgi:hypothetical protein
VKLKGEALPIVARAPLLASAGRDARVTAAERAALRGGAAGLALDFGGLVHQDVPK